MRLYLMRHCDAVHPFESSERPLSDHGRAQARALSTWLSRGGVSVDEIRHSGVLRAQETAEMLATALRPERGVSVVTGFTPGDTPSAAADALRYETGALLVVTHLPIIAHIAALLLGSGGRGEPLAFRTGALAALEGEGATWRLDWFVHPAILPPAD